MRIAVSGVIGTEPWANVFWANTVGYASATQANFDTWTANFGEAFYSNFAPQMHQSVQILSAKGTLFLPGELAMHSNHVMAHAGAQTGQQLMDLAACAVISWVTSVYWRGGKPRTYLTGLIQSYTTDGKSLTTAAGTAFANVGNAFHSAVNALSAGSITQTQHGFVSFQSGGVDRNPPIFFPVSGARCYQRLGTQRSRLGPWLG